MNYSDRTHYIELFVMIVMAFCFGMLITNLIAKSVDREYIVNRESDSGLHRFRLDKLTKGN